MIVKPRNDFVVVRIKYLDMNERGIALPQSSMQGKEFIIEAVGPKVEGLKPGDKVLMTGVLNASYFELPFDSRLRIMRQENVVIVFEDEEE